MRLKLFIISLFVVSCFVAFSYGDIIVNRSLFIKAILLYWLFSTLYSHLTIVVKKGNVNMDYGISYGLSFGLVAGPLGLFVFEFVQRFIVYFDRKYSKTADPDEFLHTFYNIGAFALNNTIAFFIFQLLYPSFQHFPFGFWLLIVLLVITVSLLSDIYLITIFTITKNISTFKEAIDFIKSRSVLDMGKTAFSNGLLYLLIMEEQWEMVIALFLLNYLVSRSFMLKSQTIQHKLERDKFEHMAYTDFLTDAYNRTYMDKIMQELNHTGECIGVLVTDIDSFKRVNDTYNHAVGDHVIQQYAATLKSHLQDKDCLVRSGGEEFTIFLRHRSFQQCVELVEKIRSDVDSNPVHTEYKSEAVAIHYTASFGLYYYKTAGETEIKRAYVYADDLLLQSKELGKNRVTVKNGTVDLPLSVRFK
ncbi:GGDEF domain-containing protein [Oceanobacillus kapialis]|uniref:GGDEF domain-containing protein n=1 Tax=Oceanobacillus kapialis TaxID=481353 RepID=A0ABW5Q2N0_9BACI